MLLLALKFLLREWRAGELRILLAALIIAVTAITSIGFYTSRIEQGFTQQNTEILGGDLVVRSAIPIPTAWLQQAQQLQLKTAQRWLFPTVVMADKKLQLVNLKVVSESYPLYGQLRVTQQMTGKDQSQATAPPSGTIWVDARLLSLLNIKLGDQVTIGSAPFRVTHLITYEPDADNNWLNVAPRVLMNMADVAKTQTVQPGSRVQYQLLLAGSAGKIADFKQWLQPQLQLTQKIITLKDSQAQFKNVVQRAESYLQLAAIICVLLAGIAIAMCANRYSKRHYDACALLRCFGLTQKNIVSLYLLQLFIIGVIGSSLGCGLGYLAQMSLEQVFLNVFKLTLASISLSALLFGLASGLLILIGFALPPFLQLKNISPLQLLRREQVFAPLSILTVYGLALGAIAALLFWQSADHYLTLLILYGIAFTAAALYGASYGLLKLASLPRVYFASAWRYGLANLVRHAKSSTMQLLAFGLVLMVMLLLVIVRHDLLISWQQQIPLDAPNYFAINIQAAEVKPLSELLAQQQVKTTQIYPVVRGRLTALNNQAIMNAVPVAARGNNALHRELNLTWTMQLSEDNQIVRGQWWQAADAGERLVSVEVKLARELGIQLNDLLTFQIGDQKVTAKVTNLRSLEWDSFRPNFFIIFPTGVLEGFPVAYMTSFYLTPQNKFVLTELVKHFPSVTLLDVDAILQKVRDVISKASFAVEYLLLFTLLAGVAVLYATLAATRDERLYEGAILHTLGATRRYIQTIFLAEFVSLGLLAGLLGALGANGLAAILARSVFDLDYHVNVGLFLLTVFAGVVLVSGLGWMATRRLIK